MKMNNQAAAVLATALAMGGNSFMMSGDGENVDLYLPKQPRFKSNPKLVDRIIDETRQKQAEKEARRAARFTGNKS